MTANPLVINSVVIGLLVTVNTIVEKSYSVRERMLLEGLAQEAALTIHTQSLEHQREERDAHIRLLLDSTVGAIYGVDLEGRCTFVNRVCLNMLGYENEAELLGRNVHNLIHRPPADGGSQPEHDRTGQGIVPTPDTLHGDDHVHWRRNGSSFPVEYWTRPIYRDGELTGTIVTFLDISERKQAQEALLRSEERYALAQHAANIGSWEYLRRVRAAAQRMALLIDDLLSLSRLTRRELHEDDVDLTAIAREVVSELRRVAPHRKAVIEIAPGLQARGDAR